MKYQSKCNKWYYFKNILLQYL